MKKKTVSISIELQTAIELLGLLAKNRATFSSKSHLIEYAVNEALHSRNSWPGDANESKA